MTQKEYMLSILSFKCRLTTLSTEIGTDFENISKKIRLFAELYRSLDASANLKNVYL